MVKEDGPAILHAKEGVLNPEQTSILRNEILGSHKNSLMNLLLDFRDAYEGIGESTYKSINTDNGVIIEHAEVNMDVKQMASDYDVARAGEGVMQKMLDIARKTKIQNRVGR